jgi:hypothetical protein
VIGNLVAASITATVAFSPDSLPNLKLWLDAADTSTISLSGSAVTQWTDKSANAYAFTQGTAAYRPASGTRTQNGKNVLDFGTNDLLLSTAASSTWTFLHDGSDYTAFIAFKNDLTGTTQFLFSDHESSSANSGVYVLTTVSNFFLHGAVRGVSGTNATDNATTTAVGTNFTYYSILSDMNNATAANRSDIRILQGAAIKNNTSTNAPSTSNPARTLGIGDPVDGSNLSIDGMIGEIIIYTSLLSAGDLLKVQEYLAAKWNV